MFKSRNKMIANRKIVQLSLLTIGTLLVLSTYFFYPKKMEKNVVEDTIKQDEMVKTDDTASNIFENVTYEGENSGNPFTVHATRAEIKEDTNIVHMKNMLITIFLKDSKWVIECAVGTYNKLDYNIFCSQDVKATDDKIIVYSQNLDLLNDESIKIYNKVLIIDENESRLYADIVNYDFENKLYHINMFDKDKSVKLKLVE